MIDRTLEQVKEEYEVNYQRAKDEYEYWLSYAKNLVGET